MYFHYFYLSRSQFLILKVIKDLTLDLVKMHLNSTLNLFYVHSLDKPLVFFFTLLQFFYCHAIFTFRRKYLSSTFFVVFEGSVKANELVAILCEIVGIFDTGSSNSACEALSSLLFLGSDVSESFSCAGCKIFKIALNQLWSTMVFIPEEEFTRKVPGKNTR